MVPWSLRAIFFQHETPICESMQMFDELQVDHALSSWLVRERGRCFQVEPGLKSFMSKFLGTLEYPCLFPEMSKLTCKLWTIHISWHSDCHIIHGFGWMKIFRIFFWDHWSAAVQTLSWHISPKVAWSFSARRVKKQKTPISRPWRRCLGKMMDVSSCGLTYRSYIRAIRGSKGGPWPSKLKLFETKPLDFAAFAIIWTHSGVIDAGH